MLCGLVVGLITLGMIVTTLFIVPLSMTLSMHLSEKLANWLDRRR